MFLALQRLDVGGGEAMPTGASTLSEEKGKGIEGGTMEGRDRGWGSSRNVK